MVNRLTTQDAAFYFLEAGDDADACRLVGDLQATAKRDRSRGVASTCRRAARIGSAVPTESSRGGVRSGPPRLGGRLGFRHHLSRSPICSAQTGFRRTADGSDRAADVETTRQHEAVLWEMYLVEGLTRNRFAIFTKSHSSLVDGEAAPEISQVIFDPEKNRAPGPRRIVDARQAAERYQLVGQCTGGSRDEPGGGDRTGACSVQRP